jgi:type I restriction enzyme S subunit
MSQTTRDFVPIRQQYGLSIILPPRQEQVEIARRVDRLLNLAKGIERRVDGAAASVAQTSQAVLAKAFRGDLTPSLSPGER